MMRRPLGVMAISLTRGSSRILAIDGVSFSRSFEASAHSLRTITSLGNDGGVSRT
jgi:hypothetical protein